MNTINIKALSEQVARLDGRVGSIPVGKIPKDYSENETNTGLKWIDGKEIYRFVINNTFGEITQTGYVTLLNKNIDTLISIGGFAVSATGSVVPLNSQIPNANFTAFYAPTTSNFTAYVHTTFSESAYTLIIYYTKPTATREPDEVPEETETKKVTRKKSTK